MAQKNTPLEKQVNDTGCSFYAQSVQVINETVQDPIRGGWLRYISPLVQTTKGELVPQEWTACAAPVLSEDFYDAAAEMWRAAWKLTDEIATLECRAHAAETCMLKAEADDALSNFVKVEYEREEAEERTNGVSKMLEEGREALQDARLEIAKLNGRLPEHRTNNVGEDKQSKLRRPPAPEQHASSTGEDVWVQLEMFPLGESE